MSQMQQARSNELFIHPRPSRVKSIPAAHYFLSVGLSLRTLKHAMVGPRKDLTHAAYGWHES